jgi:hypothetical protein
VSHEPKPMSDRDNRDDPLVIDFSAAGNAERFRGWG